MRDEGGRKEDKPRGVGGFLGQPALADVQGAGGELLPEAAMRAQPEPKAEEASKK